MIRYTTTLKNPYYFIADNILFNISEKQDADKCGQHLVTYKQSVDKDNNPIFKTVKNGGYYLDEHHNKLINESGSEIMVPLYGDKVDDEECEKIFPNFKIGYYMLENGILKYEYITYYLQDLIAVGDRYINDAFVRNNIHNNDDTQDINKYRFYHWNGNEYENIVIISKEEIPEIEEEEYIKHGDGIYHWNGNEYEMIEVVEKTEMPEVEEEEYIKIYIYSDPLAPDMTNYDEIQEVQSVDTPYAVEFLNSIIGDIEKYVKAGYSFESIKKTLPHWLFQSNYDEEYKINGKKMRLYYVSNNIRQFTDDDLLNEIYKVINKLVVEFSDKKLSVYDKRMKRDNLGNVTMVSSYVIEQNLKH